MSQKQRQWAIFYTAPNGRTYGCATHLGCCYISDEAVNLYCDKDKLKEIYEQTIAYVRRSERPPENSGHGYWEGQLMPEWRNGKVFISRVGSKNFPAELTKAARFQSEEETGDKKIWALRVPCKII